jgi:hypothetical protein
LIFIPYYNNSATASIIPEGRISPIHLPPAVDVILKKLNYFHYSLEFLEPLEVLLLTSTTNCNWITLPETGKAETQAPNGLAE